MVDAKKTIGANAKLNLGKLWFLKKYLISPCKKWLIAANMHETPRVLIDVFKVGEVIRQ